MIIPQTERLVLTLLVKDEEDIILDNILFHYAMGVDFVIVTDNGSTDGTVEILKDLETDGLILLLREEGYFQDRWVNQMAAIAREDFRATILIHSDADEFWHPLATADLKQAFLSSGMQSCLVRRKIVLSSRELMDWPFPQGQMFVVENPIQYRGTLRAASRQQSYMLLEQNPKVIFSVKDKLRKVGMGNHNLVEDPADAFTETLEILHFPVRSSEGFRRMVARNNDAIEGLGELPYSDTAWHWRRWIALIDDGKFDVLLNELVPSNTHQEAKARLREFDYNKQIRYVGRERFWLT